MKGIMPVAVLAMVLLRGAGGAAASEADWAVCENYENPAAQLAACAKIVSDDKESTAGRAQAHYLLAEAYGTKGDFGQAVANYGKAIDLAGYAIYYAARGWAYLQQGDLAHALQDCGKAIELNPNLALGFTNRGAVWEKKGDAARAIADYKFAVAIKSDDEEELFGQEDAKAALDRLQPKAK